MTRYMRLVADSAAKIAVLRSRPKIKLGEDPVPCQNCRYCFVGFPEDCENLIVVITLDEWAWMNAVWPCTDPASRARRWAGFEARNPPESVPSRPRDGSGEPDRFYLGVPMLPEGSE